MSPDQTKTALYVQRLDEARCQGNWEAVPELVRKVRKHAPARACLARTAEAEFAVTQASHNPSTSGRPSTAHPTNLTEYIPKLLDSINEERTYPEDKFQAQVCVGWIHLQLGDQALGVGRLPGNVEETFAELNGTNKGSSEWTKVCAMKASYIKGTAQVLSGRRTEALETFESCLPIAAAISEAKIQGKELQIWTENYLTSFCMLSSQLVAQHTTAILETETLSAFRAWARFWYSQPSIRGGRSQNAVVSRRQVWKAYYFTLSHILQEGIPYPLTSLITTQKTTTTRVQQQAELRRVEAHYENLLQSEVDFPRAEEPSDEVEDFASAVMQNWRILCGSTWTDQDLGEGGAEGVSREVLKLLYRAATKTFHSTAILRHLFTVHLAVAEFDLAFKAFDTYLDIVKRSRARIDKTGVPEHGLDDDGLVLGTASECIKALCRYGSRESADKAKDLGHFFEGWLEKHHPTNHTNGNHETTETSRTTNVPVPIEPSVFAVAWRCIGIAYANWAKFTFDADARIDIQQQSIGCFKKALQPAFESTTDIATLYALAQILAERREIAAALQVVKSGLQPATSSANVTGDLGPQPGRYFRERSLIPLWHLMALLLSARQDFTTASRSCEGAFEQFRSPKVLFGDMNLNNGYRSDHLQMSEKPSPKASGVIDDMDDFEKEGVMEVKMTQLSLVEVLEGPEVAVNASDELLSLYARLFGDPEDETTARTSNNHNSLLAPPPKSSAGTLRSIKGSIFGRSSRSNRDSQPTATVVDRSRVPRPQTTQKIASTRAPTIQVTSENGNTGKKPHHLTKQDKRSGSLSRANDSKGGRERSISNSRHKSLTEKPEVNTKSVDQGKLNISATSTHDDEHKSRDSCQSAEDGAINPNQTSSHQILPPKSQQMNQIETSLKPSSADPASARDIRLPHSSPYFSSTPLPRFPKDQQRRRRVTTLVKIWLLIAGFYRRAAMYEDARGALEEADKLVTGLDEDVSRDTSGSISISNPGWVGGKSVEELWGDVFSERGYLAVAEAKPYPALAHFESALTHFRDHPSAIVGLSNILLDIYNEDLLPVSSLNNDILASAGIHSTSSISTATTPIQPSSKVASLSSASNVQVRGPLGMAQPQSNKATPSSEDLTPSTPDDHEKTKLQDRITARDRAFFLLSTLTKLGQGWNYSEAWFALARAYELQGQPEKAKEVLWWCVELEDARSVRGWSEVRSGGYVL